MLVFKKRETLKKNEKWFMYDQLIEIVINKLFRSNPRKYRRWNKRKMKQMVKGNQCLVAIDKCLTRTPSIYVFPFT
jgi:hypothetical protein